MTDYNYLQEIRAYLTMQNQSILLETLDEKEQLKLLKDIKSLREYFPNTLETKKERPLLTLDMIDPFYDVKHPTEDDLHQGLKAIQQKKVLPILLAGGDGSRLGSTKPKGALPLSPIKQKSLFHLQMEKIAHYQNKLEVTFPICILTSFSNNDATKAHFEENQFFSLDRSLIHFIKQPSLPLLKNDHEWFFKSKDRLALGPNGNGGLIKAFHQNHLFSIFKDMGFESFVITSIDNVLADPMSPELVGSQLSNNQDLTLFSHLREDPEDKVGIFCQRNSQLSLVDYSSLDPSVLSAKDGSTLKFSYGNTNIFCFSLNFLNNISESKDLPLHWIQKPTNFYDNKSQSIKKIYAYKGERFLTDLISVANTKTIFYKKKKLSLSPLKSPKDSNSIESVQQDMFAFNQKIYEQLFRKKTKANFELGMRFYTAFEEHLTLDPCENLDGNYFN